MTHHLARSCREIFAGLTAFAVRFRVAVATAELVLLAIYLLLIGRRETGAGPSGIPSENG